MCSCGCPLPTALVVDQAVVAACIQAGRTPQACAASLPGNPAGAESALTAVAAKLNIPLPAAWSQPIAEVA